MIYCDYLGKDKTVWQQISEDKEVFSRTPYIKLIKRNYLVPENPIEQDYYLLSYNDWVNTVALTTDFKLLLVKQFRPGKNNFVLGIPSGNIESNEYSAELSAKRELEEETGYSTNLELIPLFTQSPNNATHLNQVHSFLALNVKPVNSIIDPEIHEVIQLDFAEVFTKIMNNIFDDDFQVLHSASILFAINYILLSDNPIIYEYKLYLKRKLNIF